MSTAVQTPEANAANGPNNALAVKQPSENITSERTDYVVGYDLSAPDKDGKVERTGAFYEAATEQQVAAIKEKVEGGKFEQIFQVTVSVPRAKNIAGIKEICPDEEEASMNFNRGSNQKAMNRLKAKLTRVNEDGVLAFDPAGSDENNVPYLNSAGVLDMTAEIASPSKRKVLTEEEKLDRFLEPFPEAMRTAMKAAYLAARA